MQQQIYTGANDQQNMMAMPNDDNSIMGGAQNDMTYLSGGPINPILMPPRPPRVAFFDLFDQKMKYSVMGPPSEVFSTKEILCGSPDEFLNWAI